MNAHRPASSGTPAPKSKDPNAAAALQKLLGGKYVKISALSSYMFQSLNFRLVASIMAEELGQVELVSDGVAMQQWP